MYWLENMFLNLLKYRHFIGQSEHVFKKVYFSLSRRPENLGLKIWLKTPIFCLGTFEKNPIFCLQLYAARQERINLFFKSVGFCGGLRRFYLGFQLYAYNYTPHPAVGVSWIIKLFSEGNFNSTHINLWHFKVEIAT